MTRLFLALCLCIISALATAGPANNQHVVLISLDGFRHDYIEKHGASQLAELASQGVRAERMTPVYPANTFPNHLSLITGRYPVNHGIINNRFADKRRPDDTGYAHYSMGQGYTDSTWLSGIPLWNLAQMHGVKAATYFWPESDAQINGMTPNYYYRYSKYADYQARVDQIIAWLQLSEVSRPRFIAGYFSLVDSQGHEYGPDAPQTKQAVQQVDALIGQLYARIQALDLPVNLIVVSDHGMQQKDASKTVSVKSLGIDKHLFEVVNQHTQLHIYARPDTTEQALDALTQQLHKTAAKRYVVLDNKARSQYHYPRTAHTGDIVLQVPPAGEFINTADDFHAGGSHGYWPQLPDMGATFVAVGPAFKQGVRLPVMSNLEVYPAVAHIMGLPIIGPIDGDMQVIKAGLR